MTRRTFVFTFVFFFAMIFVVSILALPQTDVDVSFIDYVITFGIENENYFLKDRCDVRQLEDSATGAIRFFVESVFPGANVLLVKEGENVETKEPSFILYYENINGYKRYTGLESNSALHSEICKIIGQDDCLEFSQRNVPIEKELRKNLLQEKLSPLERNPLYSDAEMISLKYFTIAQTHILGELINIGIEPLNSFSLKDFRELKKAMEEDWTAPYVVYTAQAHKEKYVFRNIFLFILISLASTLAIGLLKWGLVIYLLNKKLPSLGGRMFWVDFLPHYLLRNFFVSKGGNQGEVLKESFKAWRNRKELVSIREEANKFLEVILDIDISPFLKSDQDKIDSLFRSCELIQKKIFDCSRGQDMIFFRGQLCLLQNNVEKIKLAELMAIANLHNKVQPVVPKINTTKSNRTDPKGDMMMEIKQGGVVLPEFVDGFSNTQIGNLHKIFLTKGGAFVQEIIDNEQGEISPLLRDKKKVAELICSDAVPCITDEERERSTDYVIPEIAVSGGTVIVVGGRIFEKISPRLCEELKNFFNLSSCVFVNANNPRDLGSAVEKRVDIFLLAVDDIPHKASFVLRASGRDFVPIVGTNIENIKKRVIHWLEEKNS